MHILLTGHKGQLGRTLFPLLEESGYTVTGADLPERDITERASFLHLARDVQPDLILHPAALTDVDRCAREPALAYRVNGMGTQNVALAAQAVDAELLTVSTNEVFDGRATVPYHEWDARCPINPYGCSKLAAEWYTQHLLNRFYIVRTAWLYAAGGSNFPHKMIQLADKHGALKVVTDEMGNPTYVKDLARAIVRLMDTHAYGIYHFVNAGVASRYEFAEEILRLSGRGDVPIELITSDYFQRDSTPPPYAPLANTAGAALGITLRSWQEAVAEFLAETGYARESDT